MLLADLVFIWVGGALLIGFFGFFAVVVTAVVRVCGAVCRRIFRRGCCGELTGAGAEEARTRPCGNPRCGHVNAATARYCARCGQPLGPFADVDRYG